MSNSTEKERNADRTNTNIKIVIKGRESSDQYWKEVSLTENISKLGANFRLVRECKPGKMLSLMMQMPKNFRCYDWDKKLYPVWAVVQYCTPIATEEGGFQLGVAFVGKNAPKSYFENPSKLYKIAGMDEDGFWSIGEEKTPFVYRSDPRYPRTIKAKVSVIDSTGTEQSNDVDAVTKDISVGGTAVFSNLEASVGDVVRFTCEDYDFSTMCLVRNRQISEGEPVMLHLSFSESRFPVDKLHI